MRIITLLSIAALAACSAPEQAENAPVQTGTVQLPLVAVSNGGASYRLNPARFRIVGDDYNRVFAAGDLDLLRVGLVPGQYTIRLLGDWVLNVDEEGVWTPVVAVLQSPNPQTFTIEEGMYSDVRFEFGVGDEAIAFGQGQVRVDIAVNDCFPAAEACNGQDDDCDGAVDEAPECTPEVCDDGADNDGDGAVDCADDECAEAFQCNLPQVGQTGDFGVNSGADWEVCRADGDTAWVSTQAGGGRYDAEAICQSFGYAGADLFGGTCNTTCGYCGNPGEETYDGAGSGWPNDYGLTVNWRCTNGFIAPFVGMTGSLGVAEGADWEVCRADEESAWLSAGDAGGTYDAEAICQSLGYDAAAEFGGNCNTVCGYCGTPGEETYDGAGAGWPNAFRTTVTWSCVRM